MLSSDEGENDMFFDSLDRLSSEDSSVAQEELRSCSSSLEYEVWFNEPCSVTERRKNFLKQMGLVEFACTKINPQEMEIEVDGLSKIMELERLVECGGAVSRGFVSSASHVEETLDCCTREEAGVSNLRSNELDGFEKEDPHVVLAEASPQIEAQNHVDECQNLQDGTTKMRSWWKRFVNNTKGRGSRVMCDASKPVVETPEESKIKVVHNKKRCLEFTAPVIGQEICAHKGFIWTMKFSPDGQYLASGGEDGVVRVWRVMTIDASSDYLSAEGIFCSKLKEGKSSWQRKHPIHASVIFPDKIFRIDESPLQEFYGHSSDILDLAWSSSNCIISSSKDKTVRLWQLGCKGCLNVFHHNNYVTCIQFNPVDDNYFISGSIDGKVRIWGLSEKRVVDWTDVRDVITAICYQPDGKGFIVGSITGTCRFYIISGECLLLDSQIRIPGRKRTASNKITGIKFSQEKSQRVMISSEDSKLRIFDGVDLTHKYKGLPKSGSQMSASFTSSERHIISVGEDSRVYIWNHDALSVPSSKQTKSVRSCEHFFHEGVSVAIPWSGMGIEEGSLGNATSLQAQAQLETAPWTRDSERFSIGNWFSMDGPCRGSATWPEEKLPLWDLSLTEDQHDPKQQHHHHHHNPTVISETWGLVIVTAGLDGTIRTFHNYGLPVRL
ncbi:Coatomer beta subunit [Trema orientale]|uniref:Coatomer beta subunit n=1 Tax=Trema orientale TaxID=63057 RepID=A0A2P5E9J6_TREOI|nr:Coatomer beta subunit [Trema orientale]